MLTGLQSAEMDSLISQVERAFSVASVNETGAWFTGTTGATGVYVYGRSVEYLRGEMRDDVLAGRKTYGEWKTFAITTHARIKEFSRDIGDLTFGAAVGNGLVEAAKDVALFGGGGLLIFGGLALAVLWFKP